MIVSGGKNIFIIIENKCFKFFVLIGLAILFLFTLSIVNAAGTVNINNTTDGGIAKGIIDTETNGILNLDEGIYKGINNTNLTIDRNLTIIGKSRENTIIDRKSVV